MYLHSHVDLLKHACRTSKEEVIICACMELKFNLCKSRRLLISISTTQRWPNILLAAMQGWCAFIHRNRHQGFKIYKSDIRTRFLRTDLFIFNDGKCRFDDIVGK
jgi:hypothetical protein